MISVLLPELEYHLHIWILGKFVIFYDITGFQRRGFLQIISMYQWIRDIWFFGKLAYPFDNPFRHFFHNPEKMIGSYVSKGMTVLDVGCGMGFFSIGLAKLVGDKNPSI